MKRPIVILAGVMVLGLAAYLLLSIDRHRVAEKPKFLSLDTTTVDYIRIVNSDGDITMKKVGANWRIDKPFAASANDSYVRMLLEKAAGLELESFITKNKDKYAQFELGDSTTYVEIGKVGGKMDKFYSGKPSETYTHTYVRREGSDEVWLVSGTPRSSFSRRPNDWRDKKMLDLDRTLLTRILLKFPDETVEMVREISSPEQDTTLTKSDTSWTVHPAKGEPFKPEQRQLNRVMNTICRINALDFRDQGRDTIPDFSKPEFGVEVFLEGNQRETIDFIPNKTGDTTRWFARKNGDESTIYLIYQSSVKNLMKRPDVLKNGEEEKAPRDLPPAARKSS